MSKRLVLFVLVGVLAGVLGFFTLTPLQAVMAVRDYGFWFIAVALGGAVFLGVRDFRRSWQQGAMRADRRTWTGGAAVILAGAAFLHVHEPHEFKIVADEILLSSTAKQLHEHREAASVLRAYDYAGNFVPINTRVDKRPLTFPFLLATVHAVTGYRFENVFWLNGLLSVGLTALLFLIGRRLGGFGGGVSAVVWVCAVPLVVQNASGAGFELLNLVMILATVWLGMRYAEEPGNEDRLGLFVLTAVLLAQVRYESALFVAPVGAIVLYGWWRAGRPVLPVTLLVAPLLLLLIPWQQNVFKLSEASWQLNDVEGATSPFGLHYFYDNVGHALNFFLSFDGAQPSAWMLGVLGILAVGFSTLIIYRHHRDVFRHRPGEAAFVIALVGLLVHAGFMLCYFWGKWDDPIIRRLSLPTHLLLVLALVHAWAAAPALAKRWGILVGLAGFQIVGWSLPTMARQSYNAENFAARTVVWLQGYAKAATAAGKHILVVDPAADLMWFLHDQSSINPFLMSKRIEEFCYHFERRTFDEVYVVQRLAIDMKQAQRTVSIDHDLGPGAELELVAERTFAPYYVIRLSRIVSLDREAMLTWAEERQKLDVEAPGGGIIEVGVDGEELDQWMRKLP